MHLAIYAARARRARHRAHPQRARHGLELHGRAARHRHRGARGAAGGEVLTARFAPTGTDEIADRGREALGDRRAVLLAATAWWRWARRPLRPRRRASRSSARPRSRGCCARDRRRPAALALAPPARARHRRRRRRRRRARHRRGLPAAHGAEPVVGGVTWERRPIDPQPGPRAEAEIEGARRSRRACWRRPAATRVRESGVLFAESRMAELLGEETVLVDATLGPPPSPTASRPPPPSWAPT